MLAQSSYEAHCFDASKEGNGYSGLLHILFSGSGRGGVVFLVNRNGSLEFD